LIIRNRLFYFFNLLADGQRRWVMNIHLLTKSLLILNNNITVT
jgi:hypothetical protein